MAHSRKQTVLLHICCGVCAFHSIKYLQEQGYGVEGFFYNPNVHPASEYQKRKDAACEVCQLIGVPLHEAAYDVERWNDACAAYNDEPEGGRRCRLCYEMRLRATSDYADEKQFDYFTTTLSISPHKDSSVISDIGRHIGAARFLDINFKKNNGFVKTIEYTKAHGIYRQRYCGCLWSKDNQKTEKK